MCRFLYVSLSLCVAFSKSQSLSFSLCLCLPLEQFIKMYDKFAIFYEHDYAEKRKILLCRTRYPAWYIDQISDMSIGFPVYQNLLSVHYIVPNLFSWNLHAAVRTQGRRTLLQAGPWFENIDVYKDAFYKNYAKMSGLQDVCWNPLYGWISEMPDISGQIFCISSDICPHMS